MLRLLACLIAMRTTLVKLSVITVLLALAVLCSRYALADYYYDRAKRAYQSLNQSTLNYSHQLSPVLSDIDKSLTLRQASARSLDFKADLLYQSWVLSPDGQYFHQSDLLQRAAEIHIDALSLRHDWAYSTARLALIYSHQRSFDTEFDRWFHEAHRLGLYETRIARELMNVGLQHWLRLTEAQQELTLDFVRASIEQKANSQQAMIQLLDRYNRRGEACARLPGTPRKELVCEGI